MEQTQRNELRKMVEACRKLLERDFGNQASDHFGIRPDGSFAPIERLVNLNSLGLRQRRTIEQAMAHERANGAGPQEALTRYLRESAFTMLNRLAALKLMEAPNRKLVPESVGKDLHSAGFIQFRQVSPLLASSAADGGYRLYLELLFDDLAVELGVLFDRRLPQAVLFPTDATLRRVLDLLNGEQLAAVWSEDETIGWIYQYFTPKEQREKARKESPAPRDSYEMAFLNQFYTPRYVVEFLADNTLGRTWYEMRQGSTRLRDTCRFLVRRPDEVFLSRLTAPGDEFADDEMLSAARQLAEADEASFPPFDDGGESVQRQIELAHCVNGYERHPLATDQQWAWDTQERLEAAESLDGFTTQEILDVLFYTVRADRFGSGEGAPFRKRATIRLSNEVRRRALESRRDDLSTEEQLRLPVFVPYRAKKDPRDLKVLDPACGSGHFLLYCFDLLETIYEEAWADEYGPKSEVDGTSLREAYPDLERLRRDIPELILRHNLHGVDIDLRATQIAALALWLRAQRSYQAQKIRLTDRPRIARSNVVCAEPMPGERDLLNQTVDELRSGMKSERIVELVVEVWNLLRLAGEAGSLLKVKEALQEKVAAARHAHQAAKRSAEERTEPMFAEYARPRQAPLELEPLTDDEFLARAWPLVLAVLRAHAERAGAAGYTGRLFAEDAARGIAFVDLLEHIYDVVLMNPPFGAASIPSKKYIDDNYPRTRNDVYATFVERGLDLLVKGGVLGAITSRTGFFLSSFQKWREEILLREARMTVMADLGSGVLDTAMVETVAYCLEKPGRNQPGEVQRA